MLIVFLKVVFEQTQSIILDSPVFVVSKNESLTPTSEMYNKCGPFNRTALASKKDDWVLLLAELWIALIGDRCFRSVEFGQLDAEGLIVGLGPFLQHTERHRFTQY